MFIEKSLRSLSSAHEKGGQKQKCCVYIYILFSVQNAGVRYSVM